MTARPLVFTHLHKCSGSSLRRMLHAKFRARIPEDRMHIPEITRGEMDNLPMLEERGEPLPTNLLLLADHSPLGLYDSRVLAPGKPFRVVLLREPLDRLQSFYHFCKRASFLPDELAEDVDLHELPEHTWRGICRFFTRVSGLTHWLSPRSPDPRSATEALLACDVLGRHDDLTGFCRRFGERNPYGVRFAEEDVLHVNASPRQSTLTPEQQRIATEELREELMIWNDAAVRRALEV